MSYLQAFVIALVQGITELFPVSSLGHSVLLPAWIGGSWNTLVTQSSQRQSESSFYLAFIVALHCATAIALLIYFREDWVRIIRGFFRSIGQSVSHRKVTIEGRDERLAWMIVLATIPVGITGVALEHTFRTLFAKPLAASAFLLVNGLILLTGERVRKRQGVGVPAPADTGRGPVGPRSTAKARLRGRALADVHAAAAADARIARLSYGDSLFVGFLQVGALLAGISRSGITMVGGLFRHLDHEDAARFAFLLATPPIIAAGLLKLPDLFGKAGQHVHGQALMGAAVAGVSAYMSVHFLMRYFQTRTMNPFAIYCLAVGVASLIRFA